MNGGKILQVSRQGVDGIKFETTTTKSPEFVSGPMCQNLCVI